MSVDIRACTLAVLIIFALWAGVARANLACGDRALVVDRLKALYGEQHQFTLVSNTAILEVWLNVTTSTWTILNTGLEGTACVLAAGTGLIVDREPNPPGNDL